MDALSKMVKKLFPYNLIIIAAFFVLPMIAAFGQDEDTVKKMILFSFLKVNPQVSFFTGMFYGAKNGFQWIYSLIVGVWFLIAIIILFPSLFLFIFMLLYMVIALLGCWLGSLFKSHIDEMYL